jgi:hypothetical protein
MPKRKPSAATPATTSTASKKPRGKYDPSMWDTIIALGRKGKSKTQTAAHLDISGSTFDR